MPGHGDAALMDICGNDCGGAQGSGLRADWLSDFLSCTQKKRQPEETKCIPTLVVNGPHDGCVEYQKNSDTARVYEANRASVVKVRLIDTRDHSGNKLLADKGGTGFIVSEDGLVATDYHVVDDVLAYAPKALASGDPVIQIQMGNGKAYKARIKGVDAAKDLALLQILNKNSDERFSSIQLATASSDIDSKSKLMVLGYSGEQLYVSPALYIKRQLLKNISVAGGSPLGEDPNHEYIKTASHVDEGESGSPVLDEKTGKVVGVVSLSNQESVMYLSPVEDLQQFIGRIRLEDLKRSQLINSIRSYKPDKW